MTTPDATTLLQQAATRQADYDQQAAGWQRLHFRWRIAILILGVFTALFGVLARGDVVTGSSATGLLFGLTGLAVLLIVLIYWVNPGQRWVAFRAGGESLKTESFLYATGAEKYAAVAPDARAVLLQQRLDSIDGLVLGLQPRGVLVRIASAWRAWRTPAPPLSTQPDAPFTPAQLLEPEAYVQQRLLTQRDWYDSRGRGHRSTQGWLSVGVVLFNVVAGLLVVLNLAEWIPVATTIVGALATYSALSNSEFLANSYRQTVLQLDSLHSAWKRGDYTRVPHGFQQFVLHVEQVIAREYTGWVQLQPSEVRG